MGKPRRTALIRSCTSLAAASLQRALGQDLAGRVQADGVAKLLQVAVKAVPRSVVREGGNELARLDLDGAEALDGRVVPRLAGVVVRVAPVNGRDQPDRVVYARDE